MRVNQKKMSSSVKEALGERTEMAEKGKNREEERPLCFYVGGDFLGLREGVGFDKLTGVRL